MAKTKTKHRQVQLVEASRDVYVITVTAGGELTHDSLMR